MSPYSATYMQALLEHVASAQLQLGSTCSKMLVQPNEVHRGTLTCIFLEPKTALNDLSHSDSAFSTFTEFLSVDSPDVS